MNSIFEYSLSSPEALEVFSDSGLVDAMLRFEASLARAQASVGLIPQSAALSIVGTCRVELFDVPKIVREGSRVGNIAIPLVKTLKENVGLFNKDATGFVDFGCTSQDVMETAMALITRKAITLIEDDIDISVAALLLLAARHAADPVLTRTLMQPVSVTSFGLKCTGWAAPLVRGRKRLQSSADNALVVQLGGTVGTLAQMQGKRQQIMELMAADLNLRSSSSAWSTPSDEWMALGCELALLIASLGKIATDIALMGQFEVGELLEPHETAATDGSDFGHKRNPADCMVALTAANIAPQRVAALLAAMPHEHERAFGNWRDERTEWPKLVTMAHGSIRAMAQVLTRLQVDTQRMRANRDALRPELTPQATQEWFSLALSREAATLTHSQISLLGNAMSLLNIAAKAE
jgi:3-carboxy-cis,cis-muconate cycloisomerase